MDHQFLTYCDVVLIYTPIHLKHLVEGYETATVLLNQFNLPRNLTVWMGLEITVPDLPFSV